MNTIVSEDWINIYSFNEIYFGLNITVTWPPFTSAATLQLVKKRPPNNSPQLWFTVALCNIMKNKY
jgi:hypothetical protein